MNPFFYNNRKKNSLLGIFLLIIGVLLAFLKWGIEPQETISGVLCGMGVGLIIINYSIKKPKN